MSRAVMGFGNGSKRILATDAVVLFIGIALARGWFFQSLKLTWFLKNRVQLVALVIILVLLTSLTQMAMIRQDQLHSGYYPTAATWAIWFHHFSHISFGYLTYSLAPLIFLILFFPAQTQKTPKLA